MRLPWIQKSIHQRGLVREQKETLRILIKSANGIGAGGKSKFRQRALPRLLLSELAKDAARFMKGQEQGARLVYDFSRSGRFSAVRSRLRWCFHSVIFW